MQTTPANYIKESLKYLKQQGLKLKERKIDKESAKKKVQKK